MLSCEGVMPAIPCEVNAAGFGSQDGRAGLAMLPAGGGPATAKTGYDVIKHLIGSCKGGSTDLATNPKHMEGYGR